MSSTERPCITVSAWRSNLDGQREMLSIVSWNPSQTAMVAFIAVILPAWRLR